MNHQVPYHPSFVYRIGFIASLAGLLFGMDVGVIAGALKFIVRDFSLQPSAEGWVVSSLLIGAVIGTVICNRLSHHFGRRKTILIAGIIFVLTSIGCAVAQNYWFLVLSRTILGTAVGIASFIAPIYLSELSPKQIRGRFISAYQLMITVGILAAYVSDLYFGYTANWRAMLGVIAIPAALLFIGVLTLPESPPWLMLAGKKERALEILNKIFVNKATVEQELLDLTDNLAHTVEGWGVFKLGYFRRILCLGVTFWTLDKKIG